MISQLITGRTLITTGGDMITSLADHAKKKNEQENYDQLVGYFCKNLSEASTWRLIVSLTNNVQQGLFSNSEAKELVEILGTEFGIRTTDIQYLNTFSSDSHQQDKIASSKVIQFSSKQKKNKANKERLFSELSSALQERVIEYRQALDLVSKIIESYPDTANHLPR